MSISIGEKGAALYTSQNMARKRYRDEHKDDVVESTEESEEEMEINEYEQERNERVARMQAFLEPCVAASKAL